MSQERILMVSHGHPDWSKGGGEIAAYSLFREFNHHPECNAVFMARSDMAHVHHGGTPFSLRNSSNELLFFSPHIDHFRFSQPNKRFVWQGFREFLERYRPTVVHFHHYEHLGLELLREVKNCLPAAALVLTLHEFLAICHHHGQMIKRTSGRLCYKADPTDCHRCFPDIAPTDFRLRELFVKSFFKLVDVFIAPSEFLRRRYIDWGLPAEKIVVLENGQSSATRLPSRLLRGGEDRNRFAYFGQISPYKGVDLLLEAITLLPAEFRQRMTFEIYGSNLEIQNAEFQQRFRDLLERAGACVRFYGAYESDELPEMMADIDWVVMPSIWWENSPLVIQEAFKYGRPVICADIGGMAEKVIDGQTGLHFRARRAYSLARVLERAASTDGLWEQLVMNLPEPLTVKQSAEEHLRLYRETRKDGSYLQSSNLGMTDCT